MVNPPQFPSKKIGEGFFAQLLTLKNLSRKTTVGQRKVNSWQSKMGSKTLAWPTSMRSTKLRQERIKIYNQND